MMRGLWAGVALSIGLAGLCPLEAQTMQELPSALPTDLTPTDLTPTDLAPAKEPAIADAAQLRPGHYRLTGNKSVMPIEIRDDGSKTTIAWSRAQALPVVFALGVHGQEEVVNGYMRQDLYVIDRVYDALVFRIDKDVARAYRSPSVKDAR